MNRYRIAFAAFALLTGLSSAQTPHEDKTMHRYMIERTFPHGALDGLDVAKKAEVGKHNAAFGVKWVMSYANADKTRTFCLYEGPSEQAVRDAAKANGLPVDAIAEVPVTLTPN
jgi:hypothetical protein